MTTIADNLQAVSSAIKAAVVSTGQAARDVSLLAVSKTCPASAIRTAWQAGQQQFAESYLQESLQKMAVLQDLPIVWHFIGPIQSNKTREVAANFSWVHSVDRFKIAERLAAQRPVQLPPLQVCLQVNISREDSKSGVLPEQAGELAQAIAHLPNLHLRGLMAVPAQTTEFAAQCAAFAQLRALYEQLRAQGLPLDTLSMGMSHDFAAAIREGATIVRIGSAIFGERIYS